MPYSALPRDEDGQGRFRLRAEPGDGDAVAALTWTASEGGTACRARVSVTIRIGRGRLPFVDVNHEGTRSVFFGVERPECFNMRIVPLVVEVSGRGGRVRQRTSDVCTRRFRRTGSNRHFSLTARGGVVAFRARRPRGVYRARYRVLVNGRVVVRGGLRVRLFRGRVKVGITVRRR